MQEIFNLQKQAVERGLTGGQEEKAAKGGKRKHVLESSKSLYYAGDLGQLLLSGASNPVLIWHLFLLVCSCCFVLFLLPTWKSDFKLYNKEVYIKTEKL